MTLTALLGIMIEHWVIAALVLCPILIVTMALAALSCEVCGAPFGVFRRRNRTVDLCLRCALLHDLRRADGSPIERRREGAEGGSDPLVSVEAGPEAEDRGFERREDRRTTAEQAAERRVVANPGQG
ncbi:MAG: hypothetical protein ABI035_07570 [Gemmatimonadaceae bacterium]